MEVICKHADFGHKLKTKQATYSANLIIGLIGRRLEISRKNQKLSFTEVVIGIHG